MISAVLPVGETTQRGETSGRFGDLALAFGPAQNLALSFNLDILATYHSHSDEIEEAPLAFVPAQFMQKPVLIKEVCEGALVPKDYYYAKNSNRGWQKFEAKRIARKILRGEPNPRLVLSSWNMIWKRMTQQ